MSPEDCFPETKDYFDVFIRTAQYITHLTTKQDILTEAGNALTRFYGASLVGFIEMKNRELAGHHWIIPEGLSGDMILNNEVKKIVHGVFASGFLEARHIDLDGRFAISFLPIMWENQTTAVMLVGHRTSRPIPDELLNSCLAVAGLVSTAISTSVAAFENVAERKRAEEALRLSEERYRTLFSTMIEGFCIIEMVFDAGDRPIDYCFLEVNPAFELQTGLHAPEGKLMRDLVPDHETHWFEMFGNVALTGQPARFMNEARELERWFDVSAVRIGGPESRKVAVLFYDISKRVHAEEELMKRHDDLNAANEELTAIQEELMQANGVLLRNEQELRENEARLKEALAEKEVLLSEIHHRVKNNLTAFISLLALEGTYEESPEGMRLKKDLQNRARSMALIHETLYKTRMFSNVNMDVYLSTLTEQIAGTYLSKKSIHTVVNADGITLDLARATPCGLIINELITNVFKYAFPAPFDCRSARQEPCTLWVSFTSKDGYYKLSVRDNGIGLPETFDLAATKSLGLKLVTFLARHQLRAKVEVIRENGTEYVIRFRKTVTL